MSTEQRAELLKLCHRAMLKDPDSEAYVLAWTEVVTELSPELVADLLRRADKADKAEAFFAYARQALGL